MNQGQLIKEFVMLKDLYNLLRLKNNPKKHWIDTSGWGMVESMSQPHLEGSVRSPLTLPKMGLGSLPRLPKTQNSIAGVKTPRIEVFFIPLESF